MLNGILDSAWGQATNLITAPIRWRRRVDVLVLAALVGIILGLIFVGREWSVVHRKVVEIDLSPWALPKYAFLSLVRATGAYALSAAFTLFAAYWAAKDALAERFIIPILDILQSVPLLAFMPVVLLAMVGLFPHNNVGIELSAIVLIVTCQTWNMCFSLYQSLKTLPKDLDEVAQSYGMKPLQKMFWVELPFAAPGLVWNSMVSVANGWFFLMASEAFQLGSQDFRLPGLGAYMSTAVDQGDLKAQLFAIFTMLAIVVLLDQLLWKPIVAWSQRFQMDESVRVDKQKSWLLRFLRRSHLWIRLRAYLEHRRQRPKSLEDRAEKNQRSFLTQRWIGLTGLILVLGLFALGGVQLLGMLRNVHLAEWGHLAKVGGISLFRVLLSTLLATCWTLPVGLWIGLNPLWSRRLQPLVQIVASFPASILFVALVLWLQGKGIGLWIGSTLLMTLSTQWYLLFNVIAGARAVPANLREVGRAYRLDWWDRAWKLYFPAIFPFLVTGWITTTGGAWNASIITEYVKAKSKILVTPGLGATVSMAADEGNIPLLAASALFMAFIVVVFNRLVWVPLYRLAETRFALNR